jgi:hypothetical protein
MPLQPDLLERTLFISRNRGPAASVGLWLRPAARPAGPRVDTHREARP